MKKTTPRHTNQSNNLVFPDQITVNYFQTTPHLCW